MLVKKGRVKVTLSGVWDVEWLDAEGRVTSKERVKNSHTLEGLTHLLNTEYNGGAQESSWFAGLISNTSYTTGVSQNDTMASHPGWTEATGYSGDRPSWSPLACAAGIIVNSSSITFVATSAMVLRGLLITSDSTKGGTAGTLSTTALFGSTRTLAPGNGFRLTYTIVATGGNA